MKVRILDLAEGDLVAGYRFYGQQAPGVDAYFFATLAGEIDTLAIMAGIHFRVRRFYQMLSARFPYAIYYTIDGDEVRVWRVLDCRRDPRWVSAQLRKA